MGGDIILVIGAWDAGAEGGANVVDVTDCLLGEGAVALGGRMEARR